MSNRAGLSRRAGMAALILAMLPLPAWAEDGFTIDWQGGEAAPEVAASLAAQIRLVEALKLSPEVMAFFRAQTITVNREGDERRTRAGPRGIFFERRAVPADNPVLLHELIHRWQLERMPGGKGNADVLRFFKAAQQQGYARGSYMLSDPFEFFAMAASVVLYGHAARPPFRRDNVRQKSPELYRFIVREFGVAGA